MPLRSERALQMIRTMPSAAAAPSTTTKSSPPSVRSAHVVVLALAVGVFFTAQTVFMGLTSGRPLRFEWDVLQEFLYWVVWALLAPRVLWLARRWPLDAGRVARSATRHAATSIVVAALEAIVAFGLHFVALAAAGAVPVRNAPVWMVHQGVSLVWGVFMGVLFYWMVVGVYTALRFRDLYSASQIDAAELATRSASLEAALTGARLDALRSQLRPHFLFNTLNSISVLTREDADKARRMVIRLGSLLRRSLDEAEHEIPLRQELTFLDDYLDIQRVRFGDKLVVTLAIDPNAVEARVPVLLLQPLVENAIEHGSPDSSAAASIQLRATRAGNRLRLTIEDNGPGPGDAAGMREGIGLRNTRERLQRLYGSRATLDISVASNGHAASDTVPSGTRVQVDLPFAMAVT